MGIIEMKILAKEVKLEIDPENNELVFRLTMPVIDSLANYTQEYDPHRRYNEIKIESLLFETDPDKLMEMSLRNVKKIN